MLNKATILTFLADNGLFGSYARGDETAESDIDLVVELEVRSFSKRMALKYYLEEQFGAHVDVISAFGIRPFIWEFIKQDLVYV
jgi:predicted nucleotidyltransferase